MRLTPFFEQQKACSANLIVPYCDGHLVHYVLQFTKTICLHVPKKITGLPIHEVFTCDDSHSPYGFQPYLRKKTSEAQGLPSKIGCFFQTLEVIVHHGACTGLSTIDAPLRSDELKLRLPIIKRLLHVLIPRMRRSICSCSSWLIDHRDIHRHSSCF